MLANGLKFELDALANKDFQYLTKKYLPRKLKGEGLVGLAEIRSPGLLTAVRAIINGVPFPEEK